MLHDMSMTLRRQVRQIMDLKMKTAAQRLGSYLAGLSEVHCGAATVRLPFEKKLLACHLGMQPETLSRALMKLQDLGVRYHQTGAAFHIGDVDWLRAFCDESADED
jgi:CRP/FNR family transcriptional activator FtrB